MTNYLPPSVPQGAPNDPFEPFFRTPQEGNGGTDQSTDKWQIKPPVVTGDRIATVKPIPRSVVLQQVVNKDTHETQTPPPQASPLQAPSPLFRVSFVGPDQQWYRINAEIGQGAAIATPQLAPYSSWNKSMEAYNPVLDRVNATPPKPITSPEPAQAEEDTSRSFLLRVVQPGLAGLMDGAVSTLAPIFAVAFATHNTFTTFLVGMASALGAGISMTFAEALSDDGEQTGRGKPLLRGGITGLMTFLSGTGHALPFLIPDLRIALIAAYVVVAFELLAIAAIRHKFFGTSWLLSIVQVVGGGILVFAAALILGNA